MRVHPRFWLALAAAGMMVSAGSLLAQGRGAAPAPMTLTSPAFTDGGTIPARYGCRAQPANVSPPLEWRGVPAGTKSLVLMLHDLDPRPQKGFQDFLHWMIWNIPTTTEALPEAVAPTATLGDGARQMVSAGRGGGPAIGYRSPCPPSGVHHYAFELFALDIAPNLPVSSTRADVTKAIDGHIIGHAVLVGLFSH